MEKILGFLWERYIQFAFCFNSQFFGLETSYRAVVSEKDGGV